MESAFCISDGYVHNLQYEATITMRVVEFPCNQLWVELGLCCCVWHDDNHGWCQPCTMVDVCVSYAG